MFCMYIIWTYELAYVCTCVFAHIHTFTHMYAVVKQYAVSSSNRIVSLDIYSKRYNVLHYFI